MDTLLSAIKIVFENDDYLVINKPAGISVHGTGKSTEVTVVDWILKHYPEIEGVGEPMTSDEGRVIERPGIVHRIDKETSGILLIAKNSESFSFFKEKFKNREINKTYFAFIYGKPKDERGSINLAIGRSESGVRKWETGKKARGELREALTRYKVLQSNKDASLLEVWPATGRTHQIRVHMKAIGHPIIADALYAPSRPAILGFKRLALHASRLIFTDSKGVEQLFEVPFPADFEAAKVYLEG